MYIELESDVVEAHIMLPLSHGLVPALLPSKLLLDRRCDNNIRAGAPSAGGGAAPADNREEDDARGSWTWRERQHWCVVACELVSIT